MSAKILRQAAALMRERAEVCVAHTNEWYSADELADFLLRVDVPNSAQGSDAEHIASWHPAVVLAVADWLDVTADRDPTGQSVEAEPAFTVARAYLGGPA